MFIDTYGLSRELSNVRKRVLAQRCWEWGWVALCFLVVCEGNRRFYGVVLRALMCLALISMGPKEFVSWGVLPFLRYSIFGFHDF